MNVTAGTSGEFERLSSISASRLLDSLGGSEEVTLFRTIGNIGDRLIHAGARQLLRDRRVNEAEIWHAGRHRGETALVCGGGGWCRPWHDLPMFVRELERNFHRVMVWPSSFDVCEPTVDSWLRETKAAVMCREEESARQVSNYLNTVLALDTAFFFDYRPYRYRGTGTLYACRTDAERKPGRLPPGNVDISAVLPDLDSWLHAIARCDTVVTDRAHVMIAASMLEKTVRYRESSYHKVRAIAEYSLGWYPNCLPA